MNLRERLLLMQEIEHRNQARISAYKKCQKGTLQPSKRKPNRNRAQPKKRP